MKKPDQKDAVQASAAAVKEHISSLENQMASKEELIYLNSYGSNVRTQNFDRNWKFYFGDVQHAHQPLFDDSVWSTISIPHDYSITQEYSKAGEAESGYLPGGTGWYRKQFSVQNAEGKRVNINFGGIYMNAAVYINGQKIGTHPYGYTPFSFDITDYLNFHGNNVIAVKSDNQIPSSRWYSGSGIYRSVELTITDAVHVGLYGTKVETPDLECGQNDKAAVQVNSVIVNDGDTSARVTVKHHVIPKNIPDMVQAVGMAQTESVNVEAGTSVEVTATIQVTSPKLWSLEEPNLYLLRTEVIRDEKTVDVCDTEFGFRFMNFDADTGFSLNGRRMKLKGVCMHHDQGALGAAAYYRAVERQMELLKEMGCNAIRVTHNPSDRTFIESCNKIGMLVIQEFFDTWDNPKNGNINDFAKWFHTPIEMGNTIKGGIPGTMTWAEFSLTSAVKRDYNDPSVMMWSLGNEVMEGIEGEIDGYPATARKLIDWTKALDKTRMVTTGENKLKGDYARAQAIDMANSLTAAGGTVGFNYTEGGNGICQLDYYHKMYPDWLMYGAETASAVNSRGIYYFCGNGSQDKQRTAYDESKVEWGHVASDAWYTIITRDFMAGEFVWTGFDYIGEPTPWNGIGRGAVGEWPSPKSSYFGIIDTAGFPKDSYYLYQSQWSDRGYTLHILPAWNRDVVHKDAEGQVKVVVYSNAPSVELFFTPEGSATSQSLGRKTFTRKTTTAGHSYQIYEGEGTSEIEHENLYLSWMVPYADGTVTAKAYTDKSGCTEITDTAGRCQVKTAGVPVTLSASADRSSIAADGKDLAYITVDVVDEHGNTVPNAANCVTFTVEGEGELVGVDNGNPPDHDSYQSDRRKAFSGKVLAIVRSFTEAGSFTVTAFAEGLKSSKVSVETYDVKDNLKNHFTLKSYRMSKHYVVKTGYKPVLPDTVNVQLYHGTEEEWNVIWEDRKENSLMTEVFGVNGQLEDGTRVSVSVSVIDDSAALLPYTDEIQVGERPALPYGRPVVTEDGRILNVQLPVAWEEPSPSDFDMPGIVHINGNARVFGKTIDVKAHIRVLEEAIAIGSNAANKMMRLEQNIPKHQQSDSLEAIIDGLTAYVPVSSGSNPSCWTNDQFAREGGTRSEIIFTYATAERLGQAVIYFFEDDGAVRIPQSVELYYSRGGTGDADWIEIPSDVSVGNTWEQVTPYTYTLQTPVEAVVFKIALTNSGEILADGKKPCTGITEIELNRAIETLAVSSD